MGPRRPSWGGGRTWGGGGSRGIITPWSPGDRSGLPQGWSTGEVESYRYDKELEFHRRMLMWGRHQKVTPGQLGQGRIKIEKEEEVKEGEEG